MLLAIDIGNTNVVAGVFAGAILAARWRFATDTRRTPDEYAVLGSSLFALAGIESEAIDGAVIASVVPGALAAVSDWIHAYLGCEPLVVSAGVKLGIAVCYDPPSGVGADRIANAVAAGRDYSVPAVVVDFGTGTNFDAIDAAGDYVGGAIAPGLEIATEALFAAGAKLPQVALTAPPHAVGENTAEALQSGIVFGYAGLVDGLVDRIAAELGGRPAIIATGGLAPVVAPHTRTVTHTDLDLTLNGLAAIHALNQ